MPFTPPEHPRRVRAKMHVTEVNLKTWGTEVVMNVVSRGEDNKKWAAASPVGRYAVTIANEVAADQFFPGQEWFIDCIPIDPAKHGVEGMDEDD